MFKSVDAQEPKKTLLDLIEEAEKPKGRKDDAGKIDMTCLRICHLLCMRWLR